MNSHVEIVVSKPLFFYTIGNWAVTTLPLKNFVLEIVT